MSNPKKIVLIANRDYSPDDAELLRHFYWRKIDLFCTVGPYCEQWEEAMDSVCTDPSNAFSHHITTTSHMGESLEEVLNMAEHWFASEGGNDVLVVEP